jgi:hypothetical protein
MSSEALPNKQLVDDRRRLFLTATSAAFLASCATERPPSPALAPAQLAEPLLISADRTKGFHFPYLLRSPLPGAAGALPFLLVEPNNSGHVSINFDDHLSAAIALSKNGVGEDVAGRLTVPLLMPVFPRSPDLYTHSLSRSTLLSANPQLHRLDLQLLAMIDDARRLLADRGVVLNQRVLMAGFSASALFVTRFTALHTDLVQALVAGGVNGFVILPLDRIGTTALNFPLGIADLDLVSGTPFNALAWRRVPQFIFMGAEDSNDAVQFDDAYPPEERDIIYKYVGEKMLPDRWEKCQQLYREAGASLVSRTYAGVGHGTNGRMHAEMASFLRLSATA